MITENTFSKWLMQFVEFENRSLWIEFREQYRSQYRGETPEDFKEFMGERFEEFENIFGELLAMLGDDK
jgi:hypothetical protein